MDKHFITVVKHEQNRIFYECTCGAKGVCSIKPLEKENAAIVVDIKCPKCSAAERMTLLQYSSEETKADLIKNLNNIDLSWVPTLNEEILADPED